jgi:hypothetical protein
MPRSSTVPAVSSIFKLFALLALALLLANARAVSAQDSANNANNANVNTGNTNVGGNTNNRNTNNRNSNQNANQNTNQNANQNTNQSGNQNSNVNGNQTDSVTDAAREVLTKSGWYFALVTLLFAAIIGPFVYVIMRAILFSKGTFSNPLGLPEGSLRAMLAFMLVAYLGFYVYAGVLSLSTGFKPPDFLLGIVATVIGFYFGSRTGEDKGGGTQAFGALDGTVLDNTGAAAAGASVDLSQAGVHKFTQKADNAGKFNFNNIPVGVYDIQASLGPNATSAPQKVTVKTGAPQTVNLKLQ